MNHLLAFPNLVIAVIKVLTLGYIKKVGGNELHGVGCQCVRMFVCWLGYREGHDRLPDYSGVSLSSSSSGVEYRGRGSRKLPYPAYYSERRKTSRESEPEGNCDITRKDLDRRGLERQNIDRLELERRDLEERNLSRVDLDGRELESRRALDSRDRRELRELGRRDVDKRDLDRRRGDRTTGGGPEEGYLPDSAESGSTDADTYDSQNMEVWQV